MISPAKINLDLNILHKRKDGYHEIASIFLPLKWGDEIMIEESESFQLISSILPGLPHSGDFLSVSEKGNLEENILFKVFQKASEMGINKKGVKIFLHKNIPTGGGLGGGSSNAAMLLRYLYPKELQNPSGEFLDFISKIGADIPFFFQAYPSIVRGIGEKLAPISIAHGFGILAIPPFGISTKEAFSELKKPLQFSENSKHGNYPNEIIKKILQEGNWKALNGLVKNDFEVYVLDRFPETRELKDFMIQIGLEYVAMTGSGSSFFGLSTTSTEIEKRILKLRERFSNIHFVSFEF